MVSPEENQHSGHRFGPILAKAAFVAAATPTILFLGERADQALADTGTSVSTTSDNGHQTIPGPQKPAGSGDHGVQVETQPSGGHNTTGSGTSQAETATASNTKNTSSQQSPAVQAVPPRPMPQTAATVNTPATHKPAGAQNAGSQASASEAVSVSGHASSKDNKNTSSGTAAPEPTVPAAQPAVASQETGTAVSHQHASTGETRQAPPSAPAPAASQESQPQQQKTDTSSVPASAKASQSAASSADTGVTVPERPVAVVHDTQPSTNHSAAGHASHADTQQPPSDHTSNTSSANTSGSPSASAHQPQNDRHDVPPVAVPPRPVPHHDAGTAASGATETSQPAPAAAPAQAPSSKDGMEKVGNTIYYNQHDAPWAHARFDGGSGRGDISANGCGVTTLAEVISTQSDQVVTPVQMADEVMADHLVTYDGSTYWKAMTAVPEAHGLKADAIPVNQASLDAALAAGAEVESNGTDNDPNTPATSAGHFFDITEKAPDGNYRIADPNSRAMSAREFTAQQLLGPASFMAAVFPNHAAPAPAPAAAPAPAPAPSQSSTETADHQSPIGPVHLPGGYSVNVPVPPRPVPHGNEHNDVPTVPPRPHAGGHHDQAPAPAPTAAPAPEAPQQPAGLNAKQMQIINSLQISQTDKNFIGQAMQAAMDLRSQGVLINPQVMVGQAILESAYGQETPPDSNNFFGMKAPAGTPPDQISWAWTHEVINGQSVRVRAPFLKFPSVEAGLRGQAAFLAARPWFADAMTQQGAHDASYYLDHLLDGNMRYATQPNYKDEILNVINVNRLADIDAAGSQ